MPRRGAVAEPEAVTETEDGPVDYTIYAEKDITPTMADFADWIVQEVYAGDEKAFNAEDPYRIVALAGTLRMEFQRSDLNQERREERRLAREEARSASKSAKAKSETSDETETEIAKPARRGRPAVAKPAAGKPATRSAAKPASKPAARRGRAAAGVASY
jgi:hypothetical protein